MAGKKTVTLCEPIIKQIVNDLGYYLVDIDYKKQISGMVLEVVIDSENGITLNDCEKVSRALDQPLDEIDPTHGEPYNLNVSSVGLDRPLTTEYLFKKYLNKSVVVKLYEPVKPYGKQIIGELLNFNDEQIEIKCDKNKEVLVLTKKSIAQLVPYIEF